MSREWVAIFDSNLYVPPSTQRIKTTTSHVESFPFVVEFKSFVLSIAEPKNVLYQVRMCFYDATNRRFFGRAWRSKWIPGIEGAQIKVALNETVYFHLPYKDNSILIVIECVRNSPNVMDDKTLVGWAIFRLQPGIQMRDTSQIQLQLYQGSSGILPLLQEPVESNPKLKKINVVLQLSIKTHKVLARAFDYVPENTIISSKEMVPGLELDTSANLGALGNPVPKPPNPAVIDKLVVQLGPMADRIDSEVCELLNKERIFKENIVPNGETMMILEKRIRVGVHNGWTYLHEPYLYYLTSFDTFDTRSLRHGAVKTHQRRPSLEMSGSKSSQARGTLVLRNRIELNELVQDEGLAIVFYLEYILGLQSSKPNPPAQVVTIAWGAWSPFEKSITGPLPATVILRGGPSRNPDYVLCFRDYYSLSAEQQIRNKLEIQLNFLFILKHFLPPEESVPDGSKIKKPIPPDRKKPSPLPVVPPKDGRESLPDTPAPPPREGRTPLIRIPVKTPKTPTTPTPQPRGQPQTHYPFVLPYPPVTPGQIWGIPPALPAYPLAAPLGHMAELPTLGLLHAPILALQQSPIKSLTIPRAIMAILMAASFDTIEDRHGDLPELVDMFDPTNFTLEADLKDPLTCNEIILQFMAYGRMDGTTAVLPTHVFFTFHFYRFPEVNTERLLLIPPENVKITPTQGAADIKILRRLDQVGRLVVGKPGFQTKFIVDPHYLKPGEHKLFLEYLYYHFLYIDVWDADSLMLIGSSLLPLRQLCRRSYEAVHGYCQLPIVTTELVRDIDDHTRNAPSDIHAVYKGMLYLKVACVGYPSAGGVNTLITDTAELSKNTAVITHRLTKAAIGADLSTEKLLVRPRSLTIQYPNLRPMLVTGKKLEIAETTSFTEERRRKITRIENLRQIERYTFTKIDRTTRLIFSQDIQTIKQFREQTKDKTILAALFHSITVVHTIFPTLGSCEFMEFLLVSPYAEPCTLSIEISDRELKVVHDPREWQFYKNVYNLLTPLETSMFILKQQPEAGSDGVRVEIFLKPKENVYVPFKYQTFHAISFPNYEKTGDRLKSTMNVLLQNKTVKALFRNVKNGEIVSALLLQIEPQPHVVHQSFRFYQPEQTFLSKFIRLNLRDIQGIGSKAIEAAYCTDPTVLCEIREPSTTSSFQDIYVKAPCGTTPQVKSFSIMLYVDPYLSKPVQVWQMYIHALQKLDVSTVQGHGTRFSLVLKGSQASRIIRCFSSSPQELIVSTQDQPDPFVLQPGSVAEVHCQFKPMFTGERTLQITAVDVELMELVKSWLIYAVVRAPNVTKGYQVTIPIGQSRTVNKKLSFTNKYSIPRTFTVTSSRDDLMVVKDPILHIQPGATAPIGLRFNTNVSPQVIEIMLFINDELENNEEAYGIKAVFVLP